ncbi:MAG: hypothetical protein Q9182_007470 [Xanthomendoza sp. 2 TL-2023]
MNYDLRGQSPAIPLNSLILVTGISGYIGSHVADQLLQAGFRVRGTVRNSSKGDWVRELFGTKYGPEKIEIVIVAEMAHPDAFDEACKGVSGIIHVASDLTFSPDPNLVIPTTIAGALNAASAAAKSPSIKRFIYTSSSAALLLARTNEPFTITNKQWNDQAVQQAWAPPPYTDDRRLAVYGASKTQAEQALWKFVEEQHPGFVLNAVLPNFNIGKILSDQGSLSSGGAVKWIVEGGEMGRLTAMFGPQWMVNVQDTARLHVAALIDPEVINERILAFAYPFNFNDVLACLRKLDPGRDDWPGDVEGLGRDLSELDNEPGKELLRRFGREGWMGLEESVRDNAGW